MAISSRKIKIWLISVGVIIAAFVLYNFLFDTPEINFSQRTDSGPEVDNPAFDEQGQQVGEFQVGNVKSSRFTTVDENGNITQIFGYEKLLNPDAGQESWRLEKPYMEIREDDVTYRITSDKGLVEVEYIAGSYVPKNASLIENAQIRIVPASETERYSTTIYLDDLDYSSDRSQFSTEGPVRIVSKDADIEGKKMQLIYNEQINRVELLKIYHIDYMLFRNIRKADAGGQSPDSGNSDDENTAAEQSTTSPDRTGENTDRDTAGNNADPQIDEDIKDKTFYQCRLEEDVKIKYGDEIVVDADQSVLIENIVLAQSDSSDRTSGQSSGPTAEHRHKEAENVSGNKTNTAPADTQPAEMIKADRQENETVDVYVTCRGSVTIKPMDNNKISDADSFRRVDIIGSPVRVSRYVLKRPGAYETIARCGRLEYDLDRQILNMTTNSFFKEIFLKMPESDSSLETTGLVHWLRQRNFAEILGPGKLFTAASNDVQRKNSGSQRSEMGFAEKLELNFRSQPAAGGSMKIESAEVYGGMNARLVNENVSYVSSDKALFRFSGENQISRADLDGNVKFSSHSEKENSTIKADSADLIFDDSSSVRTADLRGNVHLGTTGAHSEDSGFIYADMARILFADNDIKQADVAGNVLFRSESGRLISNKARVIFVKDDFTGKISPAKLYTTNEPVMETLAANDDVRSTRFKARKIVYGFNSKDAYAFGPVEFSFFSQPEDEITATTEPVVITADGNAEYFSIDRRVIFNDNVIATRIFEQDLMTDRTRIFGDQLLTAFAPAGGIESIKVRNGDVRLVSERSKFEKVISKIVLKCLEMDYRKNPETSREVIYATGPGTIEIDNSKASGQRPSEPEPAGTSMSLERPSYAYVEGFSKLVWFVNDNRLVADGSTKSVHVAYVPVLGENQFGQTVHVYSSYIIADFLQTRGGRNELRKLTCKEGVVYQEQGGNEFEGSHLVYDPQTSLVKVNGSGAFPCRLKRKGSESFIFVDSLEYNIVTGHIKASMPSTPSVIPSER